MLNETPLLWELASEAEVFDALRLIYTSLGLWHKKSHCCMCCFCHLRAWVDLSTTGWCLKDWNEREGAVGMKEKAGEAIVFSYTGWWNYLTTSFLGKTNIKKDGSHSSWLPPADANVTSINWFKSFTTFISNATRCSRCLTDHELAVCGCSWEQNVSL